MKRTSEVIAGVQATVLSDSDEDWLMVGSGVDGAHAVGTGWQSTSDGRAQDTIDCLRVETPTRKEKSR